MTYILFSDEGHGFVKPNNRKAFSAVMEEFLAKDECLGGRFEPIGEDLQNSSGTIVEDPVIPM